MRYTNGLLLAVLAACGGRTQHASHEAGAPTAGAAGAAGASAGGMGGRAETAGAAGTGAGGTGGGDGVGRCGRVSSAVSPAITLASGERWAFCHAQQFGMLTGVVSESSPGQFVVGDCEGHVACDHTPVTITHGASGLTMPVGAFVEVKFQLGVVGNQCTELMYVSNAPQWRGMANPVADTDRLWLAVNGPVSDYFSIEKKDLCERGGVTQVELQFQSVAEGTSSPWLTTGESGTFELTDANGASLPYAAHVSRADIHYSDVQAPNHTSFYVHVVP